MYVPPPFYHSDSSFSPLRHGGIFRGLSLAMRFSLRSAFQKDFFLFLGGSQLELTPALGPPLPRLHWSSFSKEEVCSGGGAGGTSQEGGLARHGAHVVTFSFCRLSLGSLFPWEIFFNLTLCVIIFSFAEKINFGKFGSRANSVTDPLCDIPSINLRSRNSLRPTFYVCVVLSQIYVRNFRWYFE